MRSEGVMMLDIMVNNLGAVFRRTTKPKNIVDRCVPVFLDGPDLAFWMVMVIYIKWELVDGSFWVSIICAKSKVAALFGTSSKG